MQAKPGDVWKDHDGERRVRWVGQGCVCYDNDRAKNNYAMVDSWTHWEKFAKQVRHDPALILEVQP